jgi:uncharacterized RDD family membrane protein YckC
MQALQSSALILLPYLAFTFSSKSMSEFDPYADTSRGQSRGASTPMRFAGFGRRFGAYAIDVIPITVLVWAIFYYGTNYGEVWDAYFSVAPGEAVDPEVRSKFLHQRNVLRDTAMGVYIIYCTFMEASTWSGTLGKRLMGIRVATLRGEPLSLRRSFKRNIFKFVSAGVFALGFIWILLSKTKQGWHDSFAATLVLPGRPDHPRELPQGARRFNMSDQGPWIA